MEDEKMARILMLAQYEEKNAHCFYDVTAAEADSLVARGFAEKRPQPKKRRRETANKKIVKETR